MITAYRPVRPAPSAATASGAKLLRIALTCLLAAAAVAEAATGSQAVAAYVGKGRRQVGYCAVRLSDGVTIASRQADTPMRPASVQKICTAATALTVLGDDFRFRTVVATYQDDLIVIGDGDPTLGDPVLAAAAGGTIYDALDAWTAAIKDRGASRIAGALVLDDNIFAERRHGDWPASQRQRWYCAPVSGLNFNDNCVDVSLQVTAAGVTATVGPASRFIHVANETRRGSKQLWRLAYADEDATLRLTGQVRTSTAKPLSVAVNHPTLLLGRTLADRLNRGGVAFDGPILRRQVVGADRKLPAGPQVVAEHVTPIGVVLARANKRSLNLTAECLLLRAAASRTGRGTFADAAAVATEVLTGVYGVPAEQITVADGSGMSRNNRLSAAAAVTVLRKLARGPHGRTFMASLPISGVDGSLTKRLTRHTGRVVAKTGTLSGTAALAGYILDAAGEPAIAFAVLCNHTRGGNYEARAVIDALVEDWIGVVDSQR